MTLTTYVDFTLTVSHQASDAEVAKAASVLMRSLHAGFKEYPDQFVLALPNLNKKGLGNRLRVFRVFAKSVDDHEKLVDYLQASPGFDVLFVSKFPKKVPADFSGPYIAYFRSRIGSRSKPNCRYKKMMALAESNALWVDVRSKANGNAFRMYIDSESGNGAKTGQVNGYGLSTREAPVFVPHIET